MFKTKSTILELKKQSENALASFHTIVSNLTSSNSKIESEKETRVAEKARLDSEINELESIHSANSKVINKINKFLSDED